jgi:spore germination protein YaaH
MTMKLGIKLALTVFILGVIIQANFIFAQTVPADFVKIFYYRDSKKAWESFQKNVKSIDVIAPQSYGVNAKGELIGGLEDDFLALARKNGVKIMPLVTNSNFSETILDKILEDTPIQDKIVKALIAEAKKENYWGWQFDFEQMQADHRDQYSAFIKRAYPEFQKNNLIFSVAVIAQVSLNPNDYPKDLWQKVIGVYDYKALGSNSDFLSIMSYDQPASDGPVASMDWVKKVVRFAIGQVSANKLSLGIPFYFWKWDDKTGKLVDIGSFGRIAELFTYPKQIIKKGWHPTYQVAWVNYVQQKKKYTAWYEDSKSFSRKIDLALLYKLHGFSAWALGLEDPAIHQVIKTRQI